MLRAIWRRRSPSTRSQIFFTEARTFMSLRSPSRFFCSDLSEPLEDAPPARVAGAELDAHPVSRQDAHRLQTGLADGMGEHPVPVLQLDPVERVGKRLDDTPHQGAFPPTHRAHRIRPGPDGRVYTVGRGGTDGGKAHAASSSLRVSTTG